MADERNNNLDQEENATPVDSTAEGQNTNPQDTTPPTNTPHEVPKAKKEAPQWIQNLKNFFKMVFVTPFAMMQKLFLRLAGGKQMVEKAEQELLDEQQAGKVREAQEGKAKFLEREINDLLKDRMQDPAYLGEGLAITKVSIGPNITGDDSIQHTITIECQDGQNPGGSYQVHMAEGNILRHNSIVPTDLLLQLQKLIEEATLTTHDSTPGGMDDGNLDDPTQDFSDDYAPHVTPEAQVLAHEVENSDKGVTVHVSRSKNNADIEITTAHGETLKYTAELRDGHIHIDNLPQNCATALVAQTVYQAYKPLLQHNTDVSQKAGMSAPAIQSAVLSGAYQDMRNSVYANLQADPSTLSKTTSMFIIPGEDGKVIVARENISPENKKGDIIHLNIHHLDVSHPQTYDFEKGMTIQDGKETVGTLVMHEAFKAGEREPAWNASLAKCYYAATGLSVLPVAYDAQSHQLTEAYIVSGDRAEMTRTGHPEVSACAHIMQQEGGIKLSSERALTDAQLQTLSAMMPDTGDTVPSIETLSAATAALQEAQQALAENKSYSRYFAIGDTIMGYDGKNITLHRDGVDTMKVPAETLDSDTVQAAYEQSHSAHALDDPAHDDVAEKI